MRQTLPLSVVLALIGASALAFGADTQAASLLFSTCLLLAVAGLAVAGVLRVGASDIVLIASCLALAGLGLLRGWLSTGAAEYAALGAGAAVFIAARSAARRPQAADRLWNLTLGLGLVLGVVGFLDTFLDPGRILWLERPYGSDRLSTPFLSPNTAATFFGLLALMALGSGLRVFGASGGFAAGLDAVARRAWLPLLSVLVLTACVLMTGSRAGILAFSTAAAGLIAWDAIAAWRRGALSGVSVLTRSGPLILFIFAVAVTGEAFSERIVRALEGVTEASRPVMFSAYAEAIWLAPVSGHGLGGFEFVNASLADADNALILMHQNAAHNVLLQWALQAGLVGLAGLVALTGWLVKALHTGLRRRQSQRGLIATCLAGLVFVGLHGLVDYGLEIPAVFWMFAWVMGLGAGVAAGGSRSPGRVRPGLARGVGAVCLLAALASAYAGLDRFEARAVAGQSTERFLSRYGQSAPDRLTGSKYRLTAVGDRALSLAPPRYDLAAQAFEAAVRVEPRDGVLWAKLAYARYAAGAPGVNEALEQSYLRLPYADDVFRPWRIDFTRAIWAELSPENRMSARREARIAPEREVATAPR